MAYIQRPLNTIDSQDITTKYSLSPHEIPNPHFGRPFSNLQVRLIFCFKGEPRRSKLAHQCDLKQFPQNPQNKHVEKRYLNWHGIQPVQPKFFPIRLISKLYISAKKFPFLYSFLADFQPKV